MYEITKHGVVNRGAFVFSEFKLLMRDLQFSYMSNLYIFNYPYTDGFTNAFHFLVAFQFNSN